MGNPTFGTRQPCCRFSFPRCLSRCSNNRRRSFQNQSLTKCKFRKSLVLKFIQNGGCRGDWFVCVEPVMLEHTSTSNTLYFLYLAHSLARRRLAKPSLFSCLCTLSVATGRREALYYQSFPDSFPSHGGVPSPPRKKLPAQRLISAGWKGRNPRRRGRLLEDRSGRSRNRR